MCPWVDVNTSPQTYVSMTIVVTVIFYFTYVHTLLFLISRGWSTTIHIVHRNQASNLTMVGSVFYLVYSAYYLSQDYAQISQVICYILSAIYAMFALANISSVNSKLELVK